MGSYEKIFMFVMTCFIMFTLGYVIGELIGSIKTSIQLITYYNVVEINDILNLTESTQDYITVELK